MPIDLALIVSGVTAASGVVEAGMKAVQAIRGGLSRANNGVKKDLDAVLREVDERLGDVGVLAEAARSYLDALEQVRRLDTDALLLEEFLDNNASTLQNHLNPTYEATWETAERLLDSIDRDRGLPAQVHLNRRRWFDVADDEALTSRLNDVNELFGRLEERLKGRRYGDARAGIDDFRRPLRQVGVLLHDTLAERILGGLRQLREAPTAGDGHAVRGS